VRRNAQDRIPDDQEKISGAHLGRVVHIKEVPILKKGPTGIEKAAILFD